MSDREWRSNEGFGSQEYEWEEAPDLTLTSISEEDLKEGLRELAEEERAISYRRCVVQGGIDLIRAGLVPRGGATRSPEELASVLLGGEGRAGECSESSSWEGV
jgi:hypothetical protein